MIAARSRLDSLQAGTTRDTWQSGGGRSRAEDGAITLPSPGNGASGRRRADTSALGVRRSTATEEPGAAAPWGLAGANTNCPLTGSSTQEQREGSRLARREVAP